MRVGLHVDFEVAFGGGGIVADLALVRLVPSGVGLLPTRVVARAGGAVKARGLFALPVFLPHVDGQRLRALVTPVALGALEGLAGCPGDVHPVVPVHKCPPLNLHPEATVKCFVGHAGRKFH